MKNYTLLFFQFFLIMAPWALLAGWAQTYTATGMKTASDIVIANENKEKAKMEAQKKAATPEQGKLSSDSEEIKSLIKGLSQQNNLGGGDGKSATPSSLLYRETSIVLGPNDSIDDLIEAKKKVNVEPTPSSDQKIVRDNSVENEINKDLSKVDSPQAPLSEKEYWETYYKRNNIKVNRQK
jgi:hypothetical protein